MVKIFTKTSAETKKIAFALAKEILKTPPSHGALVIALEGNLGAGKTTFVQGFALGLGITEIPKSPTFVLMNVFSMRQGTQDKRHGARQLVHLDCYRIASAKELECLGIKEIFKDSHSVVMIEWAERIRSLLPRGVIRIRFEHGMKSHERSIFVE